MNSRLVDFRQMCPSSHPEVFHVQRGCCVCGLPHGSVYAARSVWTPLLLIGKISTTTSCERDDSSSDSFQPTASTSRRLESLREANAWQQSPRNKRLQQTKTKKVQRILRTNFTSNAWGKAKTQRSVVAQVQRDWRSTERSQPKAPA